VTRAVVKYLYLVRHGRADGSDPGIVDAERPLDRRGVHEVGEMGRRLVDLELSPDTVLVSPALRARQSAEILARTLELPSERLHCLRNLYLASATDLLAAVRGLAPQIEHAMVVGHNPGLTELARSLAPDATLADFETGAVCTLVFDTSSWSEVGPGAARELSYDSPKRVFAL
jgi:phosphohistidine phosphatase